MFEPVATRVLRRLVWSAPRRRRHLREVMAGLVLPSRGSLRACDLHATGLHDAAPNHLAFAALRKIVLAPVGRLPSGRFPARLATAPAGRFTGHPTTGAAPDLTAGRSRP